MSERLEIPRAPVLEQKVRLPKLRRPPAMPTGPKRLRLTSPEEVRGGPGNAPPGFLNSINSKSEWIVYWALAKIFGNPQDVRQGPFVGGPPDWSYQAAYDGGSRNVGGSVVDFIVYTAKVPVGIRLVTEYYHLFTNRRKQVQDEMQKLALEGAVDIVDVYDYDFLNDPTGEAAVRVVKLAIGRMERPNPLLTGVALRGTRMDRIGG
jgi:hypothetical protein